MKKGIRLLSLMLLLPIASLFGLTGCTFFSEEINIDSGFDTEEYVPPEYKFEVTSNDNSMIIDVSNVGDYGNTATLCAVPIYEYLYDERVKGMATETNASPIELKTYQCGTAQKFVVDRYMDGKDGIYYKYFVLDEVGDILAGPMFCQEITPKYTYTDPIVPINKKGMMCEDRFTGEIPDLGCSYSELNFVVGDTIVPNERFINGKVVPIEWKEEEVLQNGKIIITADGRREEVEYLDHNGKRYYFRSNSFNYYDYVIKSYSDINVKMTLIMLMRYIEDQYASPYFLKYPNTQNARSFIQVNTSNEYGAGYWGAFMEFVAKRYSSENSKYGYAHYFILGNEIDFSGQWNAIVGPGQATPTLEDYVEEVERGLRIANQSVKKYYKDNQVFLSFTHQWSKIGTDGEYSPKGILDCLTLKTLQQGNYDWGITLHPYSMYWVSDFFQGDLDYTGFNGSLNSSALTWTNLEIIQLYLEQTTKLYKDKVRSVIIIEGGIASSTHGELTEKNKNEQAAGVAYAYYKASTLSCIVLFDYYRLVDNPLDGAYFGLLDGNMQKKPSYYVWKYVDTQYSFDATNKYLPYITWLTKSSWSAIPHGVGVGNVSSYKDTMGMVTSRFDWEVMWDESLIKTRIIKESDFVVG